MMKMPMIFIVCILFIQYITVQCDHALGTEIQNMVLTTTDHRDTLIGGLYSAGDSNPNVVYKIWIQGTSSTTYNAVNTAVTLAGCSIFSSNNNFQTYGIETWGYITARLYCNFQTQWDNLILDSQFYSRVALTERSFFVDLSPSDSDNGKKILDLIPPPELREIVGKKFDSKEKAAPIKSREESIEEMKKIITEQEGLRNLIKVAKEDNKDITNEEVGELLRGGPYPPPPVWPPCPPYGTLPPPNQPPNPTCPIPPPLPPLERVQLEGFTRANAPLQLYNDNWELIHSRPWINYLEALNWDYTVESNMQLSGGAFFMFDLGVNEYHVEFWGNTYLRKLPNLLSTTGNTYGGFIDPQVLSVTGVDPYIEDEASHGTTLAAEIVGNSLGIARGTPLYYAKVMTLDYGTDIQGTEDVIKSVMLMIQTGQAQRPAVMFTAMNFIFSESECYQERIDRNEKPCAQGIVDALHLAYDMGIVFVMAAGNGVDLDDITPYGFPNPNNIAWRRCDDGMIINPVSLDICYAASTHSDLSINVWDLYYPLYEPMRAKPFITSANDFDGKMSRWRVIEYSADDLDWWTPWWSIGSPNSGACVDFTAPSINMGKTAANDYVVEDSHTFGLGYREDPYIISGTSYATPMVAAIALHAMSRYPISSPGAGGQWNGGYVEFIRTKMAQNARSPVLDIDDCRSFVFNDATDLSSIPRVQFFN